jgi:drug/metabolite transporter (DMT)-like permease
LFSLGYLMLFGSIIAFSAYTWLNKVTTPARLGTYAFVNPAIAVLLGAVLAAEPITPRAVAAMVLILSGVILLSVVRKPTLVATPRMEKCPVPGGE